MPIVILIIVAIVALIVLLPVFSVVLRIISEIIESLGRMVNPWLALLFLMGMALLCVVMMSGD